MPHDLGAFDLAPSGRQRHRAVTHFLRESGRRLFYLCRGTQFALRDVDFARDFRAGVALGR